jgi:hypothetical protein
MQREPFELRPKPGHRRRCAVLACACSRAETPGFRTRPARMTGGHHALRPVSSVGSRPIASVPPTDA